MNCVSQAKTRVSAKLHSSAGESLPEVLIAMLVACMATVALVAMTLSASATAKKSQEAFEDVCNQEAAIALSTPESAGTFADVTASSSSSSVSITVGSVMGTVPANKYQTDDFTYYEVTEQGKRVSTDTVSSASSSSDDSSAKGGA